LAGETDNDTYFGDSGDDTLTEFEGTTDASDDVMNDGNNTDTMRGAGGADELAGQAGDENLGSPEAVAMFGGLGNDVLRGGPGADAMAGEEGSDQHRGGLDNDFINAAAGETTATDAPDVVDCGDGVDTAVVLPNDVVQGDCENVR
jgi:Ca2+-binding RTX toxin-like protein